MREGWEYKKLGEVCEPKNQIERATKCFSPSDLIEYVDISSIDNLSNKIVSSTSYRMEDAPSRAQQKVYLGDIIVSTVRPNLKNVAKVERNVGNFVVSSGFCVLRVKDRVLEDYVYHYVSSDLFANHLMKLSTGANYPAVRDKDVRDSMIPFPPKPIQLAIVSELDQINDLIRLKKEQLKEYDNLAQSIFYDMFGDPVVNEKGWEVKKLGDLCEITSSKRIFANEYVSDGVPFYRSKEIAELGANKPVKIELFIDCNKYQAIKEKYGVPNKGDILIAAIGATIGKIWIVDCNKDFYFKDGNIIWLKNTGFVAVYIKAILNDVIKRIKESLTNGGAYPALTIVTLKALEIVYPPLPLQQEFSSRIEQIEKLKAEVQKTITDLETLLASRMQYWFE